MLQAHRACRQKRRRRRCARLQHAHKSAFTSLLQTHRLRQRASGSRGSGGSQGRLQQRALSACDVPTAATMPVLFSSHSFARCGPAAAVRPQVRRGALWTSCPAACRSCAALHQLFSDRMLRSWMLQAAPRLGLEPPPLRRWAVQQCGGRQPIQTAAQLTAAGDDDASCEWVERSYGPGRGKPLPLRPQLAAELRPLAALLGVADTAALSRAVAALGPKREQGLLEHGPAVAELLLSLGVPQPQVAQLLQRCPLLFSRPAEQRAALLFGQLARLGLTAPEAARCFVQMPTAAGTPDFEPAIPVLAELFAAGSSAGGSRSGEQLLGDLLRKQPAAVGLLEWNAGTLQQRISNLAQRYGPHWEQENKEVVIMAAMQPNALLLTRPAEHLLSLEAVLQQELGQQPGDGTRQLASILQHQARAAGCSPDTLRQRARALLAVSVVMQWVVHASGQGV